jgi:hypothetical protein
VGKTTTNKPKRRKVSQMALYRLALLLVNILSANAPYFTILLCLIFWMILLVRGRVLPLNQLIVSAHINIQSVMEWFKMTFYFSLICKTET